MPSARAVSLIFKLAATALAFSGCSRSTPQEPPTSTGATSSAASSAAPPKAPSGPWSGPLTRPAPERLVGIGDLHGDLDATRRALRLAGAIDGNDAWIGGKLVVVQTGDVIDRGDGDRAILELLEKLKGAAKSAGGELIALAGNHELMNASLDFRYVTPGGFSAFRDIKPAGVVAETRVREANVEGEKRGRATAFVPGGPFATIIADRPLFAKVGDTVFVHGGILPKHVAYGLDRMNDETHDWLLGRSPNPPRIVVGEDGPVWTRMYSEAPAPRDCAVLTEALAAMGAKRMVMGHTVQRGGISRACDDHAYRIDVGMSKYYAGPIEVVEITGDKVTVLREADKKP